jgi:signal transduction histidine kinase
MNVLFAVHVAAFALTAVICLGSVRRTRIVEHGDTRRGLAALLVANGVWAAANLGYLVVPTPQTKRALYILGLVAGLAAVAAWLAFCAAYTGRSPRRLPYWRLLAGVLVGLVALKVTNPLHHLYFTAAMRTTPFDYLAVHHQGLHWVALGLAYGLSFVGFFMLAEQFQRTGSDTRPLSALLGITALPVGVNIVGELQPWLVGMTYEPLGVAVFAVGTLFVYTERFRTVQRAGEVDEPILFLDREDRVRDYNRRAADLFPALAGATGEPVSTVVPELGEASASSERFALERDGETRYYRVTSSPFTAGGAKTGRSLVFTDITASERYRRRLEERTEQLEALNRVVRHDIRNDMNVVLGWGQALEDHVDETGRDALERMLRAADHTVELTVIAGDFVESLTGEEEPELKPIDLRERLTAEFEAARESHPELRLIVPDSVPDVPVRANEMVSSVFRNLLNNAVQHSGEGPVEVTVEVEELSDSVRIRIADDGPGIPDERKESVFGKGEKGLDSEGTGIGLYLVHTLVEQYGGSVRVADNEPGGAAFVVELPKA